MIRKDARPGKMGKPPPSRQQGIAGSPRRIGAHASVLRFKAALLACLLLPVTPVTSANAPDPRAGHPPPSCLELGNGTSGWTVSEHWAWGQLCRREEINFEAIAGELASSAELQKAAPERTLHAAWLRAILEYPPFTDYTRDVPVTVVGGKITGNFKLYDSGISSLRFIRSYVEGDIFLDNVTVDRPIVIGDSTISGRLDLFYVRSAEIAIEDTHLASLSVTHLTGTRLGLFHNTTDPPSENWPSVEITISRLTDQLAIVGGDYRVIYLDEIRSDGLFLQPGTAQQINVRDFDDGGMFVLSVGQWSSPSVLDLDVVRATYFEIRPRSLPDRAAMSAVTFDGANWGSDPLPLLKRLTDKSAHSNPTLASRLAKSYLDEGLSNVAVAILTQERDAERHGPQSGWWKKAVLYVQWLFVGYGLNPERGFVWILGFVLFGALVFRRNQTLRSGAVPRSWFVFALDAVIPGISLDKEHEKVAFEGWRQWVLYSLRLLGAVVVVLILAVMRNALLGDE